MKNIVILGATSLIAQSTARLYAAEKAAFLLAGRNKADLESIAADLKARGAVSVEIAVCELADPAQVTEAASRMKKIMPSIDLLLVAYGSLTDQREAETNLKLAAEQAMINYTSVTCWLLEFAEYFEMKQSGTIAVLSSVAGDRGRKHNFVYGAAKGGLSIFVQGLAHRLHAHGVRVVCLKPGFVDTPMTAGFKKGLLFSTPERAARSIKCAVDRGRDVAYIPCFWRPIMLVIRSIPNFIFKRLNI